MKLLVRITLELSDDFEKKMFTQPDIYFSPEFRQKVLGYMGYLWKMQPEDKATVDSFVIQKLDPNSPEDPAVKKDIIGVAK